METVLIIIAFLGYLTYTQYSAGKEKTELIREISRALQSRNITEYTESIPEVEEYEPTLIQDELVSLDSIDPGTLLKSLGK